MPRTPRGLGMAQRIYQELFLFHDTLSSLPRPFFFDTASSSVWMMRYGIGPGRRGHTATIRHPKVAFPMPSAVAVPPGGAPLEDTGGSVTSSGSYQ